MTPREFFREARAFEWHQERRMEELAWQTRLMLQAWVSDVPSIDQLLGREETPQEMPPEIAELLDR